MHKTLPLPLFVICLVTSSYDEVLRFKSSAARKAGGDSTRRGLFNVRNGLMQTVTDNYDANIFSMNGLKPILQWPIV